MYRSLREEIAVAAARMIAEDGIDYSTAKRKAVKQLLGSSALPRGELLPDNGEIEEEVREYQALFMGETQPARLRHLRELAVKVLAWLAPFDPYLTGPVWSGTAGEHTDIAIQCFTDSSKDVEIFLLNAGVDYEVGERPDFRGRGTVEALYFMRDKEGVMVSIYPHEALRGALRPNAEGRTDRGNAQALKRLLAASEPVAGSTSIEEGKA